MTDNLIVRRGLEEYIAYLKRLSPRSVRLIEKISIPGVQYNDPLFHAHGQDDYERMIEHLFRIAGNARLRIVDHGWSHMSKEQNHTAWIKWVFTFERKKQSYDIHGISEVIFNDNGKLLSHTNYWDSGFQLMNTFPVLRGLLERARRKIGTA